MSTFRPRSMVAPVRREFAVLSLAGIILLQLLAGCASEPKPESFGFYVVDGGDLAEIPQSEKIGRAGDMGRAIFGVRERPTVAIDDPGAFLILYRPNAASLIDNLELSSLRYERSRLYQGLMRQRRLNLNMYTHDETVSFDVAPYTDDDRMYKLIPEQPLTPGIYALHSGDLRSQGMGMEQPEVYAFRVRDPSAPAPPKPLAQWSTHNLLMLDVGESGDSLADSDLQLADASLVAAVDGQLLVSFPQTEDATTVRARILETLEQRFPDLQLEADVTADFADLGGVPESGVAVTVEADDLLNDASIADFHEVVATASGQTPWPMRLGFNDRYLVLVVPMDMDALENALAENQGWGALDVAETLAWKRLGGTE